MKRLACAGCLLALILFAGSCSALPTTAPTGSTLGFQPAPWKNGTTLDYEWLDQNNTQVGTSQYRLTSSPDIWTITQTDDVGSVEQFAAVRVDATTLAPLGETKSISTTDTQVRIESEYRNGKVSISADVNGKTQDASISVPANAIDNDQLLMTLSALPFAEGYTASYVVVVSQNALKVDTAVTVGAQETITVPAGSFVTWPVEIKGPQATQSAWYQVDASHILIEYDNGTNRMLLSKR